MAGERFRTGERLWFRGRPVIFVEYYRSAAVVRRPDEAATRVVPIGKLARDRAQSLRLLTTIPSGETNAAA